MDTNAELTTNAAEVEQPAHKELPKIDLPKPLQIGTLCIVFKRIGEPAQLRDQLWKRSIGLTTEALDNEAVAAIIKEKFAGTNIPGITITLDDIRALAPTIAELVEFRTAERPTCPARITRYIDTLNERLRTATEPPAPIDEVVERAPSPTIILKPAKPIGIKKSSKILAHAYPGMTPREIHEQIASIDEPPLLAAVADRAEKRIAPVKKMFQREDALLNKINKLPNAGTFLKNYQRRLNELSANIVRLQSGVDSDTARELAIEIEVQLYSLEKSIAAQGKDPEAAKLEDALVAKINRLKNADLFREQFHEDLVTLATIATELGPDQDTTIRAEILEQIRGHIAKIEKNIELLPRVEPAISAKKLILNKINRFKHKRIFRNAYAEKLKELDATEDTLFKNIVADDLTNKIEAALAKIKKLEQWLENAEQFDAIVDEFMENKASLKNFLWQNKWPMTEEWFNARASKHAPRWLYIAGRLAVASVTPDKFKKFLPTEAEWTEAENHGTPFTIVTEIIETAKKPTAKKAVNRTEKRRIGVAPKNDTVEFSQTADSRIKAWWPKIGDIVDDNPNLKRDLQHTLITQKQLAAARERKRISRANMMNKIALEDGHAEPTRSPKKTHVRDLPASAWDTINFHYADKIGSDHLTNLDWLKLTTEQLRKELGQVLAARLDSLVDLYRQFGSNPEQFRAAVIAAAKEKPSRVVPLNRDLGETTYAPALGFKAGIGHNKDFPPFRYLESVLGDQYQDFLGKLPAWSEYNVTPNDPSPDQPPPENVAK